MTIKDEVLEICKSVKKSTREISNLDTKTKNNVLTRVVELLESNVSKIIEANKKDIEEAKKNNLEQPKIDRLLLDENRVLSIANAIKEIIKLPDPVGTVLYDVNRDSGINVKRVRTPIGVLLTIYESRPNVTSDVASLAFKSGNSVILRCGSDSLNSSQIIADYYQQALREFNINENAITLVSKSNRDYVTELLKMENYIDVVIPRGGKSLIQAILNNTKIAVFRHLDGNCHSYVHEKADFEKARKIVVNAKLRRTGICGATESLLIDEKIANEFLPLIVSDLLKEGCEIRGDELSKKISPEIKLATKEDFYTEFLDKIISVKIVKNISDAVDHINEHSSSHTESIITESEVDAKYFIDNIESAIVMHNSSTQFADGGEFGLGAEVGISTGKLHARGPVGLEQLTTYKYVVKSDCGLRK